MSLIKQIEDLVARTELKWLEREMRDREDVNSMRTAGIFQVVDFPDDTGNSREYTSIDVEKYARIKNYGESAYKTQYQQGYKKTLTMVRIASDIDFYWEDLHQSKYTTVNTKIESLVDLIPNRTELMLGSHFSFCTATSYTNLEGDTVDVSMGDGFAMLYSAHTLNGSSTTYRTIVPGNPQLSRGCLEKLEGLARTESYNELGQDMSGRMKFDTLLMTRDPNTVNTAIILNGSLADPSGAHSGVLNPVRGKYRLIMNDTIGSDASGNIDSDKSKYVFLIDSGASKRACYLAIQESPTLLPPTKIENDSNRTDKITIGVRGALSSCIIDAKFVRGTKGDGSA